MNKLKNNFLVPVSFNFQIRYLIRSGLLEKLKAFCNPIIILFWKQEDLIKELHDSGFEVIYFPLELPNDKYIKLRESIDNFYKKKIVKSPSLHIKKYRNWQRKSLKGKLKHLINLFKINNLFYNLNNFKKDTALLEKIVSQTEGYYRLNEIFIKFHIQAIFTTAPFHYSEELSCLVAKNNKIPIYYSVLSFDNLTTRGYLPFIANHYFVWNSFNKNELLRINPTLDQDKISVTGPIQFDFYYQKQYIIKYEKWKSDKSIPIDRPVILYGANAKIWIPNEYLIIKALDNAISNGDVVMNPVILLRPHPTDSFLDWKNFTKTSKNVLIEKSIEKNQTEDKMYNKYSNFTLIDVVNLSSSLAHSTVHISYASTLAIDGACFDKPQICPYFAPDHSVYSDEGIRSLYHSEHYIPIRLSGAIDLPRNIEELIECINRALKEPALKSRERSRLLDQMITYQDGGATDRMAQKMEMLISKLL